MNFTFIQLNFAGEKKNVLSSLAGYFKPIAL